MTQAKEQHADNVTMERYVIVDYISEHRKLWNIALFPKTIQ